MSSWNKTGLIPWIDKDPDDTLDYGPFDLTAWLAGDTISTVVWTDTAPMSVTSQSETTTDFTVWLSGGTLGQDHTITARVTTAGGRIKDFEFMFKIR